MSRSDPNQPFVYLVLVESVQLHGKRMQRFPPSLISSPNGGDCMAWQHGAVMTCGASVGQIDVPSFLTPICDPPPPGLSRQPPLHLHRVRGIQRLFSFSFFSFSSFSFFLCPSFPAPPLPPPPHPSPSPSPKFRLNRRQAAAVVAHLVRSGKMGGGFAKCFVSKLREHSPVK